VCTAAERDRVNGARGIVRICMAAYRDRVYGAWVILTGLYGSLEGQSLWCKGNCNEFVWQLRVTEAIYDGYRDSSLVVCQC
jgi:hypothetical protein